MYRELRVLGASPDVAAQMAGNAHRRWRNSAFGLNRVLTIAYLDRLGVPRLCCPQLLAPPGRDPHAGRCGRGPVFVDRPLSDCLTRLERLPSV